MTIPFGKYRNSDTSDPEVPLGYLIWLAEQGWVHEDLAKDAEFEINRRRSDRPGQGKVVKVGRSG